MLPASVDAETVEHPLPAYCSICKSFAFDSRLPLSDRQKRLFFTSRLRHGRWRPTSLDLLLLYLFSNIQTFKTCNFANKIFNSLVKFQAFLEIEQMMLFQLTPVPQNVAGRQCIVESNICGIFFALFKESRSSLPKEDFLHLSFRLPSLT